MIIYARHCATCHGVYVTAAGAAPDLRRSAIPTEREAFESVVRDGALLQNGMPRFEEFTPRQLADLRQYIRTEAAKLRSGN